jgi:asparagine synthase (glutamine-hydrolysing)
MCGIAAIIYNDRSRQVNYLELKSAIDVISHRGPDGYGIHMEKNVGLGHRRLSIIDLSTGDQPMVNQESGISIVFNGEIYNYLEIKKDLIGLGYSFISQSDTEVVLKSYMQWGNDCVEKFNGMWSFVIYDPLQNLVFASRDRLGEKPMHVYRDTEKTILSSEIKSILAFRNVKTRWNLELLDIYLALGYFPAPYTFYSGIEKLLPGHNLEIKNGIIRTYKYWDLPEIDERELIKDRGLVNKKFQFLFEDSVRLRMRSDVPFGAFLSGGLDSSSVVSVMSNLTKIPIETFTIGFDEPDYDERNIALDVAKKFGTNHHSNVLHPDSFDYSLQRVLFHYDEPFGDSSALPTDYVSKYAAEKVKMVLTGDGGDEVLSGYPAYQFEKMLNIGNVFPNSLKTMGANFFFSTGNLKLNRYAKILESSTMSFNDRIIQRAPWLENDLRKEVILQKNVYPFEEYLSDFMKDCAYKDDFYKMMYFNLKLTLPEDMLTKVDRMSMANSLETRIPFLDHRIVEFMVTVDKSIKMKGLERKSVLRDTIGKSLPKSVLKGSKKGFVIPLKEWFKTKEVISIMKSNVESSEGILDPITIEFLIEENKGGKRDRGNILWMLSLLSARLKHD